MTDTRQNNRATLGASDARDTDRVSRRKRRPARRPRGVFGWIVQVFGELMITAGIIVLLFVGWELWWTNIEADRAQADAAQKFVKSLDAPHTSQEHGDDADFGDAPEVEEPGAPGTVFGLVYIPRFGENYVPRPLVQGTAQAQLDTLGLGHYPDTNLPGAAGNFAVAGHRQTHGSVLDNIDALMPGDRIYVQTAQGYYTYVYRNSEIVLPNQTDVLAPVPGQWGEDPTQSMLTMTSCNPRFGAQERIIAYSALESWRPLSAGPPQEIEAKVQETTKE